MERRGDGRCYVSICIALGFLEEIGSMMVSMKAKSTWNVIRDSETFEKRT
jgi:hypothetical protein